MALSLRILARPFQSAALALSAFLPLVAGGAPAGPERPWPNGARLVISFSMQFESGGQPEGAESPFPNVKMAPGQSDLVARTWYAYGYKQGIARLLDLWDEHRIKVTSHVVGEAAVRHPEVARAIAERGHEIAAHGMRWDSQFNMPYEEEMRFVEDGVAAVAKATGQRAVGYNCNWLRRGPNTLKVLQDLGFTYHIDDLSRDEPFVTLVRGKKFAVVPYTLRCNDIMLVEGRHFSADQFLAQLKLEFDRLYLEAKSSRRMMSVSLHDRIGGSPAMVQAVDQFIRYAKAHAAVQFMRKDEIAKVVLEEPHPLIDTTEALFNEGNGRP